MERDSFFELWSKLHGGAQITGFVRGWLKVSYAIVRPLAKSKVSPNFLTLLGVVFALLVWQSSGSWFAAILLLASLVFDGIDGSLAILTGKESKQGAVIDSIADRISEVFWALALVKVGANGTLIFITVALAFTQEYLRSRAAGLGHSSISIVTMGERPVRAIFAIVALLAIHLSSNLAITVSAIWFVVQIISLAQIVRALIKELAD